MCINCFNHVARWHYVSLAMPASVALFSDCGRAELMPVRGCPGASHISSNTTLLLA